ncbi:MAG: cbb3-type cytochrome oxidase subunit 3 [Lysobacterales bacterium]
MTFFLFTGDLLVMAFMMGLVVWVFMKSSKRTLDESARIPLEDEYVPGDLSDDG